MLIVTQEIIRETGGYDEGTISFTSLYRIDPDHS